MELNSYAPSCTVNASMYTHIGVDKKGEPIHPSTGHPLIVKPIKDIIYSQLDIPTDIEKGHSGGVFPFAYDKMYSIHDESIDFHSSGVVFQDIDHIPQKGLQKIYDNFELLTQKLPDLFCMHYSASGGGLHLYYLSPKLTPEEYLKRLIVNTIRFDKICTIFLGISLPPDIYDEHQLSIKQRFYLNRPKDSTILWNNDAFSTVFPIEQEDELINTEVSKYPVLEKKWKRIKNFSQQEQSSLDNNDVFKSEYYSITRKNRKVEHLDYQSRWFLYNSLRLMFNNNRELILKEWNWCMNNMTYDGAKTQLKTALNEPNTKNWDKTDAHMAWTVVLKFYNITPLKDTNCEDKEFSIQIDKEPNLTQEERSLLEKYM